jgi:hypothetical protein
VACPSQKEKKKERKKERTPDISIWSLQWAHEALGPKIEGDVDTRKSESTGRSPYWYKGEIKQTKIKQV